jgi:N-formylglutamate deformylase
MVMSRSTRGSLGQATGRRKPLAGPTLVSCSVAVDAPYRFRVGTAPLLVSFPHDGTELGGSIARRLTPAGLGLPDTDWHVARLYDFVSGLGASTLVARFSRYVVDLNRDPSGAALYPGASNTELCPTRTFDDEAIYQDGQEPDAVEIAERTERWFSPYHALIAAELERMRARHGVAVLLDAHSIRSVVPRFFQGVLPDLNLGTAAGKSCAPELGERAFSVLAGAKGYSAVRDGRFKGGYITRRFGDPARGVHALQLELAQKNYMSELPPYGFDDARAERLRVVLRAFVDVLVGCKP